MDELGLYLYCCIEEEFDDIDLYCCIEEEFDDKILHCIENYKNFIADVCDIQTENSIDINSIHGTKTLQLFDLLKKHANDSVQIYTKILKIKQKHGDEFKICVTPLDGDEFKSFRS